MTPSSNRLDGRLALVASHAADCISFGRAACGTLAEAEHREWWLANGRGGWAARTIAGTLTRRYHGLLAAPVDLPLGRRGALAKADATLLDGRRVGCWEKEREPMSLKGKVEIVTGGNSGIGMAIALGLAREGANIVIDYLAHPEATAALEKQIAGMGGAAIGVEADVSKVADLQRLVDAAVEKFGRIDVMLNNAGVETRTSVLDTTEEQYEKVLSPSI